MRFALNPAKESFKTLGRRFTFGGDTAKDQRIYYFNTKELVDNKFGTQNPIPFRVVDRNINLDIDVAIRCSGVYSYKITDPILFYTNVCGNVESDYNREEIDTQLKTEFISALAPAFAEISNLEIRPNQIVSHTTELEAAMNQALTAKWSELRGLSVVSIALNPITLTEEDAETIKTAQRNAINRDPNMAAATIVGSTGKAMETAAGNEAGAMNGFVGMGMAMNATQGQAASLFAMGQQQQQNQQAQAPAAGTWTCPKCNSQNSGKFCTNCGAAKPEGDGSWFCGECGTKNSGNFCTNCGKPRG